MRKNQLSASVEHKKSSKDEKKKNKKKKVYTRFAYTEDALKVAISEVRNGSLSINKACKEYNIPKGTLVNKLHRNEDSIGKMGPNTVLSDTEEKTIVDWIIQKAKIGCPMHPRVVKTAIKSVLDCAPRKNPFKDNMPGDKWFQLFLKRHPEVKLKNTEVLSKSRASVTESDIRKWIGELWNHLNEVNALDILEDPSRMFNMDETAVQLCPKTGKLLAESREKNNYYISPGQEKETLTVLCSYGADGRAIRPMIVYPYKRFPPKDVAASVPAGYVIGHSPKGWMTSETFSQFIQFGFHKQLLDDGVKFPVLLLFDGHSSHMSLQLHNFCKENSIILYCLYPNATHILQPCDVTIFRPLKKSWQKKVAEHAQTSNAVITKANFAPLFNEAFIEASNPSVIKKAFECCGLFPFNPNALNYSKCISTRRKDIKSKASEEPKEESNLTSKPSESLLYSMELDIPQEIMQSFIEAYSNGTEPENEKLLFEIWKKMKVSKSTNILSSEPSPRDVMKAELQNDEIGFIDVILESDIQFSTQEVVAVENIDFMSTDVLTHVDPYESNVEDSCMQNLHSKYSNEIITTSTYSETIDTTSMSIDDAVQPMRETVDTPDSRQSTDNESSATTNDNTALLIQEPVREFVDSNSVLNPTIPTETNTVNPLNGTTATDICDASQIREVSNLFSHETPNGLEQISINENSTQSSVIMEGSESSNNLEDLWEQNLHFPQIKSSKRKARAEKPKVFAITSEEWKKQQDEKIKKQNEQEKLKELRKFERDIKKKIKLEEEETKKKEKEKIKMQTEAIKQEANAKMKLLSKQKAETLNLTEYEPTIPKKRKVMKDIKNTSPLDI